MPVHSKCYGYILRSRLLLRRPKLFELFQVGDQADQCDPEDEEKEDDARFVQEWLCEAHFKLKQEMKRKPIMIKDSDEEMKESPERGAPTPVCSLAATPPTQEIPEGAGLIPLVKEVLS